LPATPVTSALESTHGRAAELCGVLTISSAPGAGTLVHVEAKPFMEESRTVPEAGDRIRVVMVDDVLRLLRAGKTNRQIAAELEISEQTWRTHVSNILAKLDLTSRTQAALCGPFAKGLVKVSAE
jgi:hypothetical protein